jgi:hypothetical protein
MRSIDPTKSFQGMRERRIVGGEKSGREKGKEGGAVQRGEGGASPSMLSSCIVGSRGSANVGCVDP